MIRGKWWLVISVVALDAAAVAASSYDFRSFGPVAVDALAMLRAQSPGQRAPGAQTNKVAAKALPAVIVPAVAKSNPVLGPMDAGLTSAEVPFSAVLPVAVPAGAGPKLAPLAAGGASAPAGPMSSAVPVAVGGGSSQIGILPLLGALAGLGGIVAVADGGSSHDVAPATPEPETWMTMISGFAALGLVLRRRRQRAAGAGTLAAA